jgi:glycosyltransferase involved in cell wall biosynthesis
VRILIITPIFYPTVGGAATYYNLLINGLLNAGIIKSAIVITERTQEQSSHIFIEGGSVEVVRLFPARAGINLNRFYQYVKYGFQNILYIYIPFIVKKHRPDVILVHSSFHNFPNILTPVIRYLSNKNIIISDVRDHQMKYKELVKLKYYHEIIACSVNVFNYLNQCREYNKPPLYIPVVQEKINIIKSNAVLTLCRYDLTYGSYFIFAGLLKANKGVELLLNTYKLLRNCGYSEKLVLAGLSKDENLRKQALNTPGVVVLGAISRLDLLELMSGSKMVINISVSEGMPRTSLEALALGVRTMLPQGIPEFEKFCSEFVAESNNANALAGQIQSLLSRSSCNKYPIQNHYPDAVLQLYKNLFNSLNVGASNKDSQC